MDWPDADRSGWRDARGLVELSAREAAVVRDGPSLVEALPEPLSGGVGVAFMSGVDAAGAVRRLYGRGRRVRGRSPTGWRRDGGRRAVVGPPDAWVRVGVIG